MAPKVKSLDHLVLTVRDIAPTVVFYESLGLLHEVFEAADGSKRHALSFGPQKINLHLAGAEFFPRARNAAPGTADLCFLSDASLDEWQAKFAERGLAVEAGPLPRTGATGPITSIYLRDPDANLIEISNPA